MKYIKMYDAFYDELFQCELDDECETVVEALAQGVHLKSEPYADTPILSRLRSDRHPEGNW